MFKYLNLKAHLPDLAAVLAFLLITFFFFQPLFEGKRLKQADITHHLGISKEIADYRQATGEEALWTNALFGGMPAYQISVRYGTNLLHYIDLLFRFGLPRPANYLFMYMIGFFILLRVMKVDPWLSLIGALAFGFSSYFLIILEAGHNSKAHAISYMAPTLAFIILTYRGKYLVGSVFTALFMGLELMAGHPQITYYLGFILLILGVAELVRSIREKTLPHFLKASGLTLLAVMLALMANIGTYLTTLEYSPYTIRGKAELSFDKHDKSSSGLDKGYATQWSYGIGESFTLLIPNAKGGASGYLGNNRDAMKKADSRYAQYIAKQNAYWGDQPFTSGPVYVGAIIVFLFVFGLFIVKGELKWVLLIATLLSLALGWGKNMMWLTDFFLDHFPAYNKFRAVSMILVIAELSMVFLAMLALAEVFKNPDIIKKQRKAFFISLAATGGLSLLFYLMPTAFFSFLSAAEPEQLLKLQAQDPTNAAAYQAIFDGTAAVRESIFRSDALRSFAFIALTAGLFWLWSLKKLPKAAFLVVMGLLVAIDLIPVDKRYLSENNYERARKNQVPYRPTEADRQILQDKDPDYRVLNLTVSPWQDASTSYFHKSVGGYHGAKFRRYQDLIDYHLSKFNQQVINMLNTRYIIQKGQNGQPVAIPNYGALGNAWFVKKIQWVNNADQEITYLGKVLRIENLNPDVRLQVYGRQLKTVDTIMATVPLKILDDKGQVLGEIDFSQFDLPQGLEYMAGNTGMDSLPHAYLDLSKIPGAGLLAKQQFKVKDIFNFSAGDVAVIDKRFKSMVGDFAPTAASTSIRLTSYKPNELKYESNATADGLVVFSEIYYDKGWQAYIDGKPAPHFRADYVLRAMLVPAGKHEIVFTFHPASYFLGKNLMLVGSSLIILLLLFLAWQAGFRKPKTHDDKQ